jgi:hypothetical protein
VAVSEAGEGKVRLLLILAQAVSITNCHGSPFAICDMTVDAWLTVRILTPLPIVQGVLPEGISIDPKTGIIITPTTKQGPPGVPTNVLATAQ